MKMQINKKVIYYLYKYVKKSKILNSIGFNLLNDIYNNKKIINLNKKIINWNKTRFNKINMYRIINIIKNNSKHYIKFKKYWVKFKKIIIKKIGFYIKSKTVFIFLVWSFHKIIVFSKDFQISETNFIIMLSKIIKNNIEINKNYHLYISYLIYHICLKLKWFKKNLKIFNIKKKQYFIQFNSSKFFDIINQIVNVSVQFPYLIPTKFKKYKKLKEFIYKEKYKKIINYLNSQQIRINKDYFKYLLYMNIKDLYILSDKNIDLSILNKKNNKLIKKDNEIIINAFKYLLNLYMVNKYINKTFYFEHFYDWRGRIYQKSWPMNSLYTKITAPLFFFNKEEYNIKYPYNNFDTIFWYKSYNINPFKILDIRDATNSMFQIAGCLTYDINLLKYTNIHNENIKYNIYDYVLYIFKNNIEELKSNIGYIYDDKLNKIDKDFIKKLIMPWSYNENTKTSIKKICNELFNSYINCYNYTIYWKKAYQIHSFIFKIFNDKFKFYNVLKQFFNNLAYWICKNNKTIIINHKKSNTHSFIQKYCEEYSQEIYIGVINNKKIKKKIKIIDKNKVSIKDNKRALIANTIQYLDSVILTHVILKCKEKGIPILTNHDCFYTTIKQGENVLKIYNECLYEYLIDYDFLNDLIIENNIDFNSKDKHIKKLKKIYQEILETKKKK